MAKDTPEADFGLKTFFIAPDLSMIPKAFVELAFMEGYETYFVFDDHHGTIQDKVKVLIENFKEIILFFTIDKSGSVPFWIDYIGRLQAAYGETMRIGILYKNINSDEVNDKLKRSFLFDIGITCGCIPMHFSMSKNQNLLLSVLKANQAEGRRKSIRLECSSKYTFNIIMNGIRLDGRVHDVSVSHFACSFTNKDPELEIWTLVKEIQLRLNGIICQVDGVVALRRIVSGTALYVFVFRNGPDRDGLDDFTRAKINTLVSEQYQRDMDAKLHQLFKTGIPRIK